MCVLGQLLVLRQMFLCYNRYLISHFISTLRNVRLSWQYFEGYCLLGYMMCPPPCHWWGLVGFPLCVLESCIPLATWIPVCRSCYLCYCHLWVDTMLVWFTKTCNLLFSAVDADMLKCCMKWNSHSISSKVGGGVKFLCFPKPLQLCGQWVLCM